MRTPYDENIARFKGPNWSNEECRREGYLRCLKDMKPLVAMAREALQNGLLAGLADALVQFDAAHGEAKP